MHFWVGAKFMFYYGKNVSRCSSRILCRLCQHYYSAEYFATCQILFGAFCLERELSWWEHSLYICPFLIQWYIAALCVHSNFKRVVHTGLCVTLLYTTREEWWWSQTWHSVQKTHYSSTRQITISIWILNEATGSCKNEAKITVSDRRTIRGKKVNGGVISVPACLGYGFYM